VAALEQRVEDCDGVVADGFLPWKGDGHCDDGLFGVNFNCEEHAFDDGDCTAVCEDQIEVCHLLTEEECKSLFCADCEFANLCDATCGACDTRQGVTCHAQYPENIGDGFCDKHGA
jgi:hypothetical protein